MTFRRSGIWEEKKGGRGKNCQNKLTFPTSKKEGEEVVARARFTVRKVHVAAEGAEPVKGKKGRRIYRRACPKKKRGKGLSRLKCQGESSPLRRRLVPAGEEKGSGNEKCDSTRTERKVGGAFLLLFFPWFFRLTVNR